MLEGELPFRATHTNARWTTNRLPQNPGEPTLRIFPNSSVRFVQIDSLPLRFERVPSTDSLLLEARLYEDRKALPRQA